MLGAIVGDIIGSCYEAVPQKTKDFPLFPRGSGPTDDSILTIALADSLLHETPYVSCLHDYYARYPRAGYGRTFARWAKLRDPDPYNSLGNGGAMRVSPVAWRHDDLDSVLAAAEASAAVTHDHPEGIEGAVVTAAAIFLARSGHDKPAIRAWVAANSSYDLDRSLEQIRPRYAFEVYAKTSVPEAIIAFLESTSTEDAIRNAISLGGDADTQACIAGAIAEAYYGGVEAPLLQGALERLDPALRGIAMSFAERYVWPKYRRAAMARPEPTARWRGALLGSIVGDALGVPVEFTSRGQRHRDPVTGMRGEGTWSQPAGTWSDDSSMSLATMATLLEHGFDQAALLDGFCRWAFEGWWTPHGSVFDIGTATRDALSAFRAGTDWRACGNTGLRSNGNGSLMRMLPISLLLAGREPEDLIQLSSEASALTHAHPRSRLCCAYHALLVQGLLQDLSLRDAMARATAALDAALPADEAAELAPILDGSILDWPQERIRSDGYVVHCLGASLWCLVRHRDYPSSVLAAVNLGDDSDTTACVTGGLAGLLYGSGQIPADWLATLARGREVRELVEAFIRAHGPA